ncbi:MAG: response regulator [Holosporales bacterium]|jgi:CheY-like chemotaxis protein|nr:response regulator [Holosporales bacterium]
MKTKKTQSRSKEPKPVDISVGRLLRENRDKRGLTLGDAGKRLGVSLQQVQKYEQARSKASFSTVVNLLNFYGVDVMRFIDDVQKTYPGKDLHNNCCQSATLLIVEDNPGDVVLALNALRSIRKGINVVSTDNVQQMLRILRGEAPHISGSRPDLILLDLCIPQKREKPKRGEGISAIRAVKQDRRTSTIPIVVLTNNSGDDIVRQAYDNGANGYIYKSMEFGAFRNNLVHCVKYWTETIVPPARVYKFDGS